MKKLIGVILLLLITTTIVIADPPPLVWCHRHQRYHHKDHTMLADNLISWWSMDEESDGSAPVTRRDSHGTNHLEEMGAFPVVSFPGVIGNSAKPVSGEPNNGYLEVTDANQSGLDVGTQDFALAFWYYLDLTGYGDFCAKYKSDGPNYGWAIFMFFNRPALFIHTTAGPTLADFDQLGWLSPHDYWMHLVFNFDRDGNCDFWQDGVLQQSVDISDGASIDWSTTTGFTINAGGIFGAEHANAFDEFGFWVGRTLTDAEIAELYNGGDGIGYPSPVANIQDWIGIEGIDDTYTGVEGTDDTYTGVEGTDNQYPALIGVE